jgi:hypothetical protein
MKTPAQISRILKNELQPIARLLKIQTVPLQRIQPESQMPEVGPGVYVFFHSTGIVRVGKSKSRCLRRSLEHIRDNTRGGSPYYEMKMFKDDPTAGVTYISLSPDYPGQEFWIPSIECLMEEALSPIIPSHRNG